MRGKSENLLETDVVSGAPWLCETCCWSSRGPQQSPCWIAGVGANHGFQVHYKILEYTPEELAKQIRCSQRGCGKQQGSQYGEDTKTNSHRGMVRKQRSNSFPRLGEACPSEQG